MKAIFHLTSSSKKNSVPPQQLLSEVVAGLHWAPDAVKTIDVKNVGEVMKNVKNVKTLRRHETLNKKRYPNFPDKENECALPHTQDIISRSHNKMKINTLTKMTS